MSNQTKHILIIRLSAMGDVAMTVPVIRRVNLLKNPPKITVLTRSFFKPFFDEFPNVTVFTPDLKGKHKGIIGLFKLYKELAALRIDLVADLHNVIRLKILVALFRVNGVTCMQLDKGRKEKKQLIEATNPNDLFQLKSMHERYVTVFNKLGYELPPSSNYTQPDKKIPSYIKTTIEGTKRIGIAPFTTYKSKTLPISILKKLIKQLSNITNSSILLFGGGEEEKSLLDDVAKEYTNVHSIVKKGSFKEELDLISNLDVMISMDSGNGHIAAMYNIPVITIWGLTHPFLGFTPYNQPMKNQILPDLEKYPLIPTSVYGNKYPETYLDCFNTISLEKIIAQTKHYL